MGRTECDELILVGRNLRALLKQRGLSITELAELAGLSRKTLNNVLSGRHASSVDVLSAIARVLRVPLWALFLPDSSGGLDLERLALLVQQYVSADTQGRTSIDAVAALAARRS
jgi:transcriptional regulator with XRE-family HTH domain